jgi:hypothetical protein
MFLGRVDNFWLYLFLHKGLKLFLKIGVHVSFESLITIGLQMIFSVGSCVN